MGVTSSRASHLRQASPPGTNFSSTQAGPSAAPANGPPRPSRACLPPPPPPRPRSAWRALQRVLQLAGKRNAGHNSGSTAAAASAAAARRCGGEPGAERRPPGEAGSRLCVRRQCHPAGALAQSGRQRRGVAGGVRRPPVPRARAHAAAEQAGLPACACRARAAPAPGVPRAAQRAFGDGAQQAKRGLNRLAGVDGQRRCACRPAAATAPCLPLLPPPAGDGGRRAAARRAAAQGCGRGVRRAAYPARCAPAQQRHDQPAVPAAPTHRGRRARRHRRADRQQRCLLQCTGERRAGRDRESRRPALVAAPRAPSLPPAAPCRARPPHPPSLLQLLSHPTMQRRLGRLSSLLHTSTALATPMGSSIARQPPTYACADVLRWLVLLFTAVPIVLLAWQEAAATQEQPRHGTAAAAVSEPSRGVAPVATRALRCAHGTLRTACFCRLGRSARCAALAWLASVLWLIATF